MSKPFRNVRYGGCGSHQGCQARFRFSVTDGQLGTVAFKPHDGPDQPHSQLDAIARSCAKSPTTKTDLRKVKSLALADPKKSPLAIHAECGVPLNTVQNVLGRMKRAGKTREKYLDSKTKEPEAEVPRSAEKKDSTNVEAASRSG